MSHNITVSNVSPLLSYIPACLWFEGNATTDSDLQFYKTQSYHATNSSNGGAARVTFQWQGTGIWLYGGYRQRLGTFQVILDGAEQDYEGYSPSDPENFTALLYGQGALPMGPHQIELVNTSEDPDHSVLDLDYLVFESPLGNVSSIEGESDRYSWFPQGESVWTVVEGKAVSHASSNVQAGMTLNFTGSAIALYGGVDSTNAPLSITLDNWTATTAMPNTNIDPISDDSHLLYFHSGLSEGNHTLLVRNSPTLSSSKLNISHVHVYTDLTNTGQNQPTSTAHINLVVGLTVGFALLILAAILAWRIRVYLQARRARTYLAPRPFTLAQPSAPSSYSSHATTASSTTQYAMLATVSPPTSPSGPAFDVPASTRTGLPLIDTKMLPPFRRWQSQRQRQRQQHGSHSRPASLYISHEERPAIPAPSVSPPGARHKARMSYDQMPPPYRL